MEPKVYRDPLRGRILWIGIGIAVVVLVAIALATLSLDRMVKSSGAFTGQVLAKEFTPAPAQEITIGRGGLHSTNIAGEYLLKVETPDKSRVFNVWVDRETYDKAKVGGDYYVVPTP